MAHIQITDLNPSNSELMDELTAEELLAINGWGPIGGFFHAVGNVTGSTLLHKIGDVCDIFDW